MEKWAYCIWNSRNNHRTSQCTWCQKPGSLRNSVALLSFSFFEFMWQLLAQVTGDVTLSFRKQNNSWKLELRYLAIPTATHYLDFIAYIYILSCIARKWGHVCLHLRYFPWRIRLDCLAQTFRGFNRHSVISQYSYNEWFRQGSLRYFALDSVYTANW